MKTKKKKKDVLIRTNPNGANQYLLDPRQNLCWGFYIDPKSETFSNALASAMKAGYPEGTAQNITVTEWFIERTRRMNMLNKAERNLDEFLDLPSQTQAMGAFGPIFEKKTVKIKDKKTGKMKTKKVDGDPIMVFNPSLLGLKQKTSEFVAERIGKARYGRKEGEGGNTYNTIIFADGQRAKIAQRVLGGGPAGDPSSEGAAG